MPALSFACAPLAQSLAGAGADGGAGAIKSELPAFPPALAERLLARMEGAKVEDMLPMRPELFKDVR